MNNTRATILKLVENGATDKHISDAMGWAPETVHKYVGALMSTLPGVGLYGKFLPLTAFIAREYEADPSLQEDLIQDIWTHLWSKRDRMPLESKAWSTWIHEVTTNFCKNYVRNLDGIDLVLDSTLTDTTGDREDMDDATTGSFLEETITTHYGEAEEHVACDELEKSLGKLSEQEGRVFDAIYVGRSTVHDVAKVEKTSQGSIGTIISRIRDKAGVRKHNKASSRPSYGSVYADWSWKPNGIGNLRMENNNHHG